MKKRRINKIRIWKKNELEGKNKNNKKGIPKSPMQNTKQVTLRRITKHLKKYWKIGPHSAKKKEKQEKNTHEHSGGKRR